MSWRPLLFAFLLLWGCSSDTEAPNGPIDSGRIDSGSANLDAGGRDATTSDASTIDAGVPQDICNPVDQTGCPCTIPGNPSCDPAKTKCILEGGGGARCITPPAVEVPLGGACVGGDCDPGLVCVNTSTAALCRKLCDWNNNIGCESLGSEYECRSRLSTSNTWGFCSELPPTCNHITQDPCPPAEACQPTQRRTGTWEFRCRDAGPAGEGDTCGAGGERCARELVCISDPTGSASCHKICDNNNMCTAPQQCTGTVNEPSLSFLQFCDG